MSKIALMISYLYGLICPADIRFCIYLGACLSSTPVRAELAYSLDHMVPGAGLRSAVLHAYF